MSKTSKIKDNTLQYKTEIKHGFESLEPGNNGIIETNKLADFTTLMNSKKKSPFLYNTIMSLTSKKEEDNEETLSYEEYISFIDDQLSDTESREGLKAIFSVFCDENKNNFSWTKFALIAKELGDNDTADKLLKLLEMAKLYTKDINFKEFSDMMTEEYLVEDNKDYENKETYKQKKKKNKKKEEEEEEEMSSKEKNEEKKSGDDNDGEKSNKRYHRRYRDNKTKNDNSENGNGSNNKAHFKYRKKH